MARQIRSISDLVIRLNYTRHVLERPRGRRTCRDVSTVNICRMMADKAGVVVERHASNCPRIYVMIDIVIAPLSAPQVFTAPLGGVQHPLAPEVMAAVRQRGPKPVVLWSLINSLANARNPDYRAVRRCWRLRYWGAVRELLKTKLLFRHGPLIATRDFAFKPEPKTAKHPSPSVAKTVCQTAGSNAVMTVTAKGMEDGQLIQNELASSRGRMLAVPPKSENAKPTAEQISAAASLLAMRPRP